MVQSFTLRSDGHFEEVIKKSKFIGRVSRARSYEEAELYLNNIKDNKATHTCWAYRSATTSRSSDDGEPAGTAGRPMLSALEAEGTVDAIVVVTRYYGGIKLGSGGLARAYGGAAKGAILNAQKVLVVPTCAVSLQVELGQLLYTSCFNSCKGSLRLFGSKVRLMWTAGTVQGRV
jgi:uncharacterized YigZ family protein